MSLANSALGYKISNNVQTTAAPPIIQGAIWASKYQATASRPLLNLSQGVPGVLPPPLLRDALSQTSGSGSFGYGPDEGEVSLRQAVAEEIKWVYGGEKFSSVDERDDQVHTDVDVNTEDVAITAGCNMAFTAAAMCIAQGGDEVILPLPWYFNHQMTLNLLGVSMVPLHTLPEDGFAPSPDRCAELITPKTRAIVLVTPNNPTGAIYSPALLASFADLARRHNIALIIDETYRDFILSGPPHYLFSPAANADPSLQPQDWSWRNSLISLFSFSKNYCIPGHRLGGLVASPSFISHFTTVLDCIQICPPRPAQQAIAPLIKELRPFVLSNAHALKSRHDLFKTHIPPSWRIASQGGYYAFVRHPFKGRSGLDVCKRLATEMGVVALPAAFFLENTEKAHEKVQVHEEDMYIRFSVANVDDDSIVKVCERLRNAETELGWEMEE